MKAHLRRLFTVINLVLLLSVASVAAQAPAVPSSIGLAAALGTSFTYQGRLTDGGTPANGAYDFQFKLYDSASVGNLVGSPNTVTINNQTVTDGLFAVVLDFGASPFAGEARYLEIGVRPGTSNGAYTALTPRQALTPAPYALYSDSTGALRGRSVSGAAPAPGQVLKWDGAQWLPSADTNTTYTTGVGLFLSGTQINVNFAGSGSATTAARSDHTHLGQSWVGAAGTGLHVESTVSNGTGLEGVANSGANAWGVAGFSTSGLGVYGYSGTNIGVQGQSNSSTAILGIGNRGVEGQSTNEIGVAGFSTNGPGVYGRSYNANGFGVYGYNGVGGWAGYFAGNVRITGSCCGASAGSYQIDHPLDPTNKYLNHASVESSEMKDIYDGVATLDANGQVVVQLPDWFEAINQDFRYQLTSIGGFAPVYIAQEIKNNRFAIAGGDPGMKVSWQITGIRHDPYAAAHPIQVEQVKPATERGKYLHPKEYGKPETMGVDYQQQQQGQTQQPTSGR